MRLTGRASSRSVRCVAALVLGICLALAMPPVSWWPLTVVAVAGLALLCRDASAGTGALVGGAFGFGFVLVCMWWLQVIVPGLQLAIAVTEMPFFALLGAALASTSRLPGWPVWGACCWVGTELLRGNVPFGGLPWGRLGTAVVDTPVVTWARYLGEGGLTLVVALACTLLAAAVVSHRAGAALAVVVFVALVGGSVLLPVGLEGPPGREVTVAVVQGNVPGSGLESFSRPRVTLQNHVAATRELASDVEAGEAPAPDLVIWPENASDIDPLRDAGARALVQRAVDEVGSPVVVGAVTVGPGPERVQGTGILWRPGSGPAQRYAKRRLVPFGEFVPFRPLLTGLVPLIEEETPRDFAPGRRPGVLDAGSVTVGAVMCFEVAYDAAIRDVARAGVDLLAVQTNNAFYLGTGQLEQQWSITRLRAIETGRAVAVAATTGISAVVAPDGTVLERTHSRAQQTLVAQVPAGQGRTLG
ncbi:MAG: apolipoprotein N-acyltransferase, partial [Nocardioidaceae bacterium]